MNEDVDREKDRWLERAHEPEQTQEWLRQSNLIYGGLIVVGVYMVQPFLTAPSLDVSAKICVVAFSIAIPLLSALVLVNQQETFRRRATTSILVSITKSVAQAAALVGLVAGFWHISWLPGVGMLVSGFVAMGVHSAGYYRLEAADAASQETNDAGDTSSS